METKRGYFPPNYVTLKMLQERRLHEKQQQQEEERRRAAAEEERQSKDAEQQQRKEAAAEEEGRRLRISRAGKKPQNPPPSSIPCPAAEHTDIIRQPPEPFRSKNPMAEAAVKDRTPQGDGASSDSQKEVKKRRSLRRKEKKKKNVGNKEVIEEEKKPAEDAPAKDDTLDDDSCWKDPSRWQKHGKYWPIDTRDVFRLELNKENEMIDKIVELKVSESHETPAEEVGGRPRRGNSGSRGYGGFSSRGRPAAGRGAAMVWVKKATSS